MLLLHTSTVLHTVLHTVLYRYYIDICPECLNSPRKNLPGLADLTKTSSDSERSISDWFLTYITYSVVGGRGGYAARLLLLFSFPCSADHERDWPRVK